MTGMKAGVRPARMILGGLVVVLVSGILGWSRGADEEALRWAARATARTGFVFFAAAFFATPLNRLLSGSATQWLVRKRRSLGLIFALGHAVHVMMIAMLWIAGATLGVSAFSVGWLALLMVAIMAATSNDLCRRKLGASWKRLHTFGGFLIAYVFGLSLLPAIQDSRVALVEFAVLCLGLCARFVVLWLDRRGKRGETKPRDRFRLDGIGAMALALLLFHAPVDLASDSIEVDPDRRHGEVDQTGLRPLIDHRPGPMLPFGRAHPNAPRELAQFAFLIGEFECLERIQLAPGKWWKFRAVWRARYILGGMGIQDEYWTARAFATTVRVFDPKQNGWIVDFYRMPDFEKSNWISQQRGQTMVMRRVDSGEDGPTFFEITAQGFRWNSGGPDPTWLSRCRRTSGPLDTSK